MKESLVHLTSLKVPEEHFLPTVATILKAERQSLTEIKVKQKVLPKEGYKSKRIL